METPVSFFSAEKYLEIGNTIFYQVIVPEIGAEYFFGIDPVNKEVSYFTSSDFSKPDKKIGFTSPEKSAHEMVGNIPGINPKVAAILFLKAAYHLINANSI